MPKTSVEYATDQITVYRFCPYMCLYCWAWRIPLFRKRITQGAYDPIKEAERYTRVKSRRTIVISFTSDPYPFIEQYTRRTYRVLKILRNTHHKVMVLTKNPWILWSTGDYELFENNHNFWLGTTVISMKKEPELEPRAIPPDIRLWVLEQAYEKNIHTWLSIEPIIPGVTYPEEIVKNTIKYVDFYVLGAFNYQKLLGFNITEKQKKVWYEEHVTRALEILEDHGKNYVIKKELMKYLRETDHTHIPIHHFITF